MQNIGGYSLPLNFLEGAYLGQSPLLPETCVGAVSGPSNPDGQCVRGGRRLKSGACEATPIFAQGMVPYTSGTVTGSSFQLLESLKGYTRFRPSNLAVGQQRPSR
ncbi:MAG: hypothetical protein EBV73_01640 [Rhodocyclales bacterium]|jgi:hypothetical protein|nr:hypothetical protein [Rhodocyclales bacterium]